MSEEDKQLGNQDVRTEASPAVDMDINQGESRNVTAADISSDAELDENHAESSERQEGSVTEARNAQETESEDIPEEVSPVEDSAQGLAGERERNDASKEDTVIQLTAELEVLRSQLEERSSQYMRIAADFENFRKRTAKEKQELEQRVKRDTLTELLPVVDSFERARSQIKPQTDQEDGIQKSYQSVFKQFVDCLKRIGVSPMRAKGTPFNPEHHEAVLREPTDQYEEGVVVEELVKGYMLADQVLRHSMVKVAAPPEPESSQEGNNSDQPENSGVE